MKTTKAWACVDYDGKIISGNNGMLVRRTERNAKLVAYGRSCDVVEIEIRPVRKKKSREVMEEK